jgi:hypothetical protein
MCIMYTNQGRFGVVIPGKVYCGYTANLVEWSPCKYIIFFTCTWMSIKNTGVKYMLKPHPQLTSGPFAYIEKWHSHTLMQKCQVDLLQIPYIFIGLAYQGNDIVFRFIIEYIKGFWPLGNRSIFSWGFFEDYIFDMVKYLSFHMILLSP